MVVQAQVPRFRTVLILDLLDYACIYFFYLPYCQKKQIRKNPELKKHDLNKDGPCFSDKLR